MAKKQTKPSTTDEASSPSPQAEKCDNKEDKNGQELLKCLRQLIKDVFAFGSPHQSVKIVSLAVPGGATTLGKDIGGDQATVIDMTPGPLTVSGTCVNLTGDVQGLMLGLDQNITILQNGLTTYTGVGSRRWSVVFPQNPPGVPAGQYAVVLQCCFSAGSPLDSLSFMLVVPPAPGPAPQPAASGS